MASGSALGPLFSLAITVVGIGGMVRSMRARRARRNGTAEPTEDELELQKRRSERAETERRMAAYLNSRPRAGE